MNQFSMSGPPFEKQTHRICTVCKKDLKANKFHVRKNGRLYSNCKLCANKRSRKNTKKYNLARRGLTLEDFYVMGEKQGWLCEICGKPETVFNKHGLRSLCVDHDHTTGEVRGLLCTQCNHLLGNAKDDIRILTKAIEYLYRR